MAIGFGRRAAHDLEHALLSVPRSGTLTQVNMSKSAGLRGIRKGVTDEVQG